MMMASNLKKKIIKNKKIKEHILDILMAYIGGFLFVIIVYLFVSGTNDKGMFDIGIDFLNSNRWKFASGMGNVRSILDEFAFGFVFTYMIIFIRRQYKKL
jgi:glycerol uptake facilitator-like aquaporin